MADMKMQCRSLISVMLMVPCCGRIKVLRIMKFIVTNGHPQFRQELRKKSQGIADAISK